MSNIMRCPYGHVFSKTRNGTICPTCGFDLDTPEKVYVNLRKECGLSLKEERPVCAWLVCIEGARRGKSYVISYGENFVGTDRDNEIQVLGDEKMLGKLRLIIFDKGTKEANLIPARADGIVYMDNKPIYDKYVIKNKDILEIGGSKFMYVDFLTECKKYLNDFEYEETDNEDKENLIQKEKNYRKIKREKATEEEKYRDKMLGKNLSMEEEKPIYAWIVCIEGTRQGKSYNITEGKNHIGSHDTMSIQFLGDEEIRDKKHAVIAYDERNLQGTLLGEESMGFVRLNEAAIYTSKDLKEGDILEIGKSKFFYFDFAKEYHQW
jgi:FHA domain containing protein